MDVFTIVCNSHLGDNQHENSKQLGGNKLKIKLVIGMTLLFFGCHLNAFALDGERKGFIIGVGAGLHRVNMDYDNIDDPDAKFGLATSLKIGGGITNQFTLYYVRNASWFKFEEDHKSYTAVTGISGIGATYYFSPTAPSGYILGAIGVGDIDAPFEDDVDGETGSAFMIGGGYEFSPHVHIEGTFISTDIDFEYMDLTTRAFQITINYLWY